MISRIQAVLGAASTTCHRARSGPRKPGRGTSPLDRAPRPLPGLSAAISPAGRKPKRFGAARATAGHPGNRTRVAFAVSHTCPASFPAVVLAHSTTVTAFFVAEAVLGAGYGAYVAVDTALVIDSVK